MRIGQNTTAAIRIAKERHGGRDVERFEAFAAARATVDEVDDIAETALRKKHNLELSSTGYPTEEVLEAGTSLAALRDALRDCRALVDALQSLE